MSNIEDIEILEGMLIEYENCRVSEVDMQVNVTFREKHAKAINNILAERKQDKARIKELEEENEKNIERYEERDNEVWERVKQCKNMQTEIDRLYIDKKELQQAYLHEKLAKEEVEELLEESIPKQKVKKLKESVILDNTIVGGRRNAKTLEYGIKLGKIKAYEELLEDK